MNAGIDGIEHGTGLDDATIATMAERQVALVPTLINIETFPDIAERGEAKFPSTPAPVPAHLPLEAIGKARTPSPTSLRHGHGLPPWASCPTRSRCWRASAGPSSPWARRPGGRAPG